MAGNKFDSGKVRLDLLPFDAIEGAGEILTFGAEKYGARNWEEGMDPDRLLGAALRHLFAHSQGEFDDPESGMPHIDHALTNVMMLSAYGKRGML